MTVKVFKDDDTLAEEAAEELIKTIQYSPKAVICMASGNSPKKTCSRFVEKVKRTQLDLSGVHFIGLDEWVGIDQEDPGSCHYFLKNNLILPLNIGKEHFHLFNANVTDLAEECIKMDDIIDQLGGIDLMVVGIGMNAHIGFNEPGIPFHNKCHVAALDGTTQQVGQKYFTSKRILKKGITLGLQNLIDSRKVILLANGIAKAPVVAQALKGEVTPTVPASILQKHPNSLVMLDTDAASAISQ